MIIRIMKGSAFGIIILLVCILAILAMGGYIFYRSFNNQTTNTAAPISAMPTIAVKDFAPGLPMSQKATILIQTSDSSDIKYVVPKDQVSTYVKNLPEGYHVASQMP